MDSEHSIKVKTNHKYESHNSKIWLVFELDRNKRNHVYDTIRGQPAEKCWLMAGKYLCKTGFLAIPDVYFEFFLLTKTTSDLEVVAKFYYEPVTIDTTSLQVTSMYASAVHSTARDRASFNEITDDDRMDPRLTSLLNCETYPTATRWMKAVFANYSFYWNGLELSISLQHETWSDNEECSRIVGSFRSCRSSVETSTMLFSPDYSDLKIICGDAEFAAHKLIMCSKSSVLKTMFNQEMTESKTGLLKIEDTEACLVEELIRFIYTGEVKDMERNAQGLYIVADKYDVQDLKLLSEQFIIESINCENVLEIYEMGKLWDSERIISQCLKEIKRNKKSIWGTPEDFEAGVKKYRDLMFQLFTSS